MESETKNKYILCVGLCTLDIIHVLHTYPDEDSDRRLVKHRPRVVVT